jgi:hypothetical protein
MKHCFKKRLFTEGTPTSSLGEELSDVEFVILNEDGKVEGVC